MSNIQHQNFRADVEYKEAFAMNHVVSTGYSEKYSELSEETLNSVTIDSLPSSREYHSLEHKFVVNNEQRDMAPRKTEGVKKILRRRQTEQPLLKDCLKMAHTRRLQKCLCFKCCYIMMINS